MFSRRVFGGPADSFRIVLEYGQATYGGTEANLESVAHVRLPKALATIEFSWEDVETEAAVVERFAQRVSALQASHGEERLHATLRVITQDGGQDMAQGPRVELQLQHSLSHPALRCISVARVTSSGTVSEPLLRTLLQHCQMEGVWKVKGADGFGNYWATCIDAPQLVSVRNLNLSYCSLAALPPSIGALTALRILRLSHNKLTVLPGELGQLTALEVLAADANLLTSVPVELRRCVSLKELNLEGNRIATPVLDLRPMQNTLQSLQLYGNPLEYLPELSPCSQLRSLSLANVRIMADATYTRWEVEVGALPYMARGHKLAPLFRLTFRRASLQHPLLAGALGRIAEDKSNCELIAKEEVALQQLSVMALSDNHVVVRQACKTLGHLAACGVATVRKLMSHDVASAVNTLIMSAQQDSQLCGLNVLSDLASSSDTVSADLLTEQLLARLHELILKGDPAVRQAALLCLSSLCYCATNRRAVRAAPGLLSSVAVLAQAPAPNSAAAGMMPRTASRTLLPQPGTAGHRQAGQHKQDESGPLAASTHLGFASGSTRLSALRVLAVLGETDSVQDALNLPRISRRGVRVLALDGGGMKGITLVQVLRAMQARLPKPLHTYWDLVVGTSTGAIVAVSMAVLRMPLDSVEAVYTELGQKVFNAARVAGTEESAASWRDSLYRVYRSSSQHMRVAVYGSKHDPSAFESLVKDFADMKKRGCLSDQLIDTAALAGIPKVALVSTLTSVTPAQPFLFRTYELPPDSAPLAAHIAACDGSSRHEVWQAVRASASAPYYLDDFPCGEDRFQDGATTANNPALIALQQARLLWPSLHVECLVSLGCGTQAPGKRERSVSAYLDTGNVLIESACSTDRVHEALATTLPLLPNTHYFRFQPVDERFAVELDDVSAASIAKLQTAATEYCVAHSARFDSLAELLQRAGEQEEDEEEEEGAGEAAEGAGDSVGDSGPLSPRGVLKLGRKRGLLVLHAPREPLPPASSHPPCVHATTVTALSSLPQLLRAIDLTTTCSPAPLPANTTHGVGDNGGQQAGPGGAAGAHGPHSPQGRRPIGIQSHGSRHASFSFDQQHSLLADHSPHAGRHGGQHRGGAQHGMPGQGKGHVDNADGVGRAGSAGAGGTGVGMGMGAGAAVAGTDARAKLSITCTLGPGGGSAPPATPPVSPVVSPPAQGDGTSKVVPSTTDVSGPGALTSPSQTSNVSTSIFNYFLPRWGTSPPAAGADASAAAGGSGSSPHPPPLQEELSGGSSATTAPQVQVLPPSHSITNQQSVTTPTTSTPAATTVGLFHDDPLVDGVPGSSRHSLSGNAPPTTSTASMWFPWTASAGPSSPVVSPSTSMASHTFSPTHESTPMSPAGPSMAQQGPYLFRSRSKTEVPTGPPSAGGTMPRPPTHSASSHLPPLPTSPPKHTAALSPSGSQDVGASQEGVMPGQRASSLHGSASGPQLTASAGSGWGAAVEGAEAGVEIGGGVGGGRVGSGASSTSGARTPVPVQASSRGPASHSAFGLESHPLADPLPAQPPEPAAAAVTAAVGPSASQLLAAPSLQNLPRYSEGGSPEQLGTSPQRPHPSSHNAANQPQQPSLQPPTSHDATAGYTTGGQQQASHTLAFGSGGGVESYAQGAGVVVGNAGGVPRPSAMIQGLLQDLGQQGLGVVHLALEQDSGTRHDASGLVTQWSNEVLALMEPGPQASHLVHKLGGGPGSTLADVTGGALTFNVGLARYTRLSLQEVTTPTGMQVRSMLYSVSRPCQMLTASDVAAAGVEWSSLLVTASCVMPLTLIEAFLRAGARALVCLAHEPANPQQQAALPAVFQQLLQCCMSGAPLLEAIQAAEAQDGAVCEGLLVCHHT